MSTTWGRARRIAADAAGVLPAVEVTLADSLGLVLAAPVLARTPLPAFDVAAADGWAVSGPGPWQEELRSDRVVDGAAVPVRTGDPLLPGSDAVVSYANGIARPERSAVWVYVGDPRFDQLAPRPGHLEPGTNIAYRGRTADLGTTRAPLGVVVTAAVIAAAAESGHDVLAVIRPPDAVLVIVGDERWDHGASRRGRTRDAVSPAIAAAIVTSGGRLLPMHLIPGTAGELRAPLQEITEDSAANLILVTGPAGHAARTDTLAALEGQGATILIEDLSIDPGYDAILARTRDGRLIAYIPGDPLGAITALATIAVPALTAFAGRPFQPAQTALLDRSLPGHLDAARLVGGQLHRGELADTVEPVAGSGIRTLTEADVLIVVPPGGAPAGALVELAMLP